MQFSRHGASAAAALTICAVAFAAESRVKPAKPAISSDQRFAQALLKNLSLRDRIAQLIIGECYGDAPSRKANDYRKYVHWVSDLHIGGLIVVNRVQYGIAQNAQPHAMAVFLNQMQRLAKVPLIVGADFERGASMRVNSGTRFPYNMAFAAARDLDGTRFEGEVTAREAWALGVQWVFAPVSDVNNNPDNPVINIRSFGEDPDEVSQHVKAFIEGARFNRNYPIILSAKHFPGHGDTSVDSHFGLPRLDVSRERMDMIELKPFEAALASGIDSVMTAHMTVPALEPDEIPATASPKVLTSLLRNELGFKGIIVTDAMNMQGFAEQFNSGEGSIRALEAGADVLLMPPDPERAIRAVAAAVEKGRLTRKRIDESALRVLAAKVHVGLQKKRLVDLDAISDALESPDEDDRVQQISDHAVTLLKNDNGMLPLPTASSPCMVITNGSRLSLYGQRMSAEFRRRIAGAKVTIVDPSMNEAVLEAGAGNTNQCSSLVVAVFGTGGPMRGDLPTFIQKLTEGPIPVTIVAMGNPYVLGNFPKAVAALATFNATLPSEVSAVRALIGEIPITGHTPVTIPGLARYGDGIQLAARSH